MKSQQKLDSCVSCLKQFNSKILVLPISLRKKAALEMELFYLLQFLTIEKPRTIFEATKTDIEEWLTPAIGFSDYALRIELLTLISSFIPTLKFNSFHGPLKLRLLPIQDLIFWRRKHQKIESQTRAFFHSITQEQIIDSEIRCIPFYKALHSVNPGRDDTGGFSESDEDVVNLIRGMNPTSKPSITDLGCGGGRLLKRLHREFPGATLNGTSIFTFSDQELDELKSKNINPIYCSVKNTGLPDQSQDIVVSTEVIEHLRNPEEMAAEIKRILKPGGIFCVTAPSKAAQMYCKNPFSYLLVAISTIFPRILPDFHNLYSPLTPIKIVHFAFSPEEFGSIFSKSFSDFRILTRRFIALRKFRVARIAPNAPILNRMGGLCVVIGRKN
jgi:2-polyprenyl-3-methyl-5-hydroxy-6-metoxy-1,4-benzoquinol methylase